MRSDRLTITTREHEGAHVLELAGELDAHTAPLLARELSSPELTAATLVISLAGIEFIDSAGLGVIVEGHASWTTGGRKYTIRDVPERVMSVFEYAGLRDHLNIQ